MTVYHIEFINYSIKLLIQAFVKNLSHSLQNKLYNINLSGLSVSIASLSEHSFKILSHTGHKGQVLHLKGDSFMFPLCKLFYNPFKAGFPFYYSLDLVITWFTQSPTQKSMNSHRGNRISMFMSCFITCSSETLKLGH